ncbi:hypothetical protein FIU87_06240 [Bacillus sp. THAF10]|uniref:hypothetical protein n=1 Tax=Bacillus sp. THAF10 TaxID=2587848 RepID=UPI001267C90B|nr:hypothetical protein [Bacillus sp. THAF10]QFT88234.1 hypothetical protein FIU87_06240 [Bacillus sp. THAF10]
MEICPLCNGLKEYHAICQECGGNMIDLGRITDFLDDYSAYMEINTLKLVDGDLTSLENQKCLHLVVCYGCQSEQMLAVTE